MSKEHPMKGSNAPGAVRQPIGANVTSGVKTSGGFRSKAKGGPTGKKMNLTGGRTTGIMRNPS